MQNFEQRKGIVGRHGCKTKRNEHIFYLSRSHGKAVVHELWVWILQPVRRGFKHIVRETMRQRRRGDAAGNELASHGDARDRMPRSKSADDFSEMES